ncbi:hypothetical protein ACFY2V_17775 [Streptomyces eurythermus]|uniref:hypothetical protein n=1 Tax=Streptomyces eurythermus TaxID=42237 RepID=UPI0036CD47A6
MAQLRGRAHSAQDAAMCRGPRRGAVPADSAGRVVGLGDSTEGSAAMRFAFREAKTRGCALRAVRTWRRPPMNTWTVS